MVFSARPASASSILLGSTVDLSTVDASVSKSGSATVVDPGVEFSSYCSNNCNVDVHDAFFDVIYTSDFRNGPFSHLVALSVASPGVPSFVGAIVDPATTVAGFGAGQVSFTGTSVTLNTAGVSFTEGQIIRIDVETAGLSQVPEPETIGTFGFGVLLLAAIRRKIGIVRS